MLTTFRSLALVLLCIVMISCAAPAAPPPPEATQAQPPEQQSEFIPIDQLPPAEQMPAAPLLIGAYAFVAGVLFVYLWSLGRRLTAVQREVDRLEADMKRSGRA